MSECIIQQKHIVTASIPDIIDMLRRDARRPGLLKDIKKNNDTYMVTCPEVEHSNGYEHNPDCGIIAVNDKTGRDVTGKEYDIPYGYFHCFACGAKGTLTKFVQDTLLCKKEDAEQWLIDNCCDSEIERNELLQPITLSKKSSIYLNESILDNYKYFHPYMWQRHIKPEVIEACEVGYDKDSDMIIFPVRDEHGRLVMLTRRSTKNKTFIIDKEVEKPVYLLYNNLKWGAKTLYICESQFNALTLIGYGLNAVALFGTGTPHQMNILNKCGIINFVLCFDGDNAGYKAIDRFKKNIRKDAFVSYVKMLPGKDVNDLTEEQFFNLPVINM